MAVGKAMASQFSANGAYYAHLSVDGKVQIWNTASGVREQEYIPNFHLTSPCTCLHFVERCSASVKNGSPRKKMKRKDFQDTTSIVLGTTSGSLLVYSVAKADLEFKVDGTLRHSISCLSWCDGELVYSGAEQSIIIWDIDNLGIKKKWKAGNENITAVLAIPGEEKLLSASKNIKLWNTFKAELLKTFVGHYSEVTFLYYINPKETGCCYFVSAAKGDRILNCWNLKDSTTERKAVASFLMEDSCNGLSVIFGPDGSTNMAAVTRSGVAHVYRHTLNGKCNKPLKPKNTIQVVADTGQNDSVPLPISIANTFFVDELTLIIGYGSAINLTFERLVINQKEKVQCLIRKDPRAVAKSAKVNEVSKTFSPVVDNDVHYLTPYTSSSSSTVKRKSEGRVEVPMEKRLENLQLDKPDGSSKVPRADNVAHLLVQGLHSNDKSILRTVLAKTDDTVIRNTVRRLPMPVIVPLVKELAGLIRGKTALSQVGTMWLKGLLKIHAGLLVSNPDLSDLVGPVLGSIETRLMLQAPLSRLRGRLDLLVSQVSAVGEQEVGSENALLTFNDKVGDDSDSDVMDLAPHSDSDHEWVEESSDDSDPEDEQEESDVDMVK